MCTFREHLGPIITLPTQQLKGNTMNKKLILKSTTLAASMATILVAGIATAHNKMVFTDVDGDGVISAEEITTVMDAKRAEKLAQYDTDGNGELSRLEKRAMKDARYNALLIDFDADGDGELSRDERRAAKQARRTAVEAMLDVNGDGVLSEAESAGMEQVREERGLGHHGKRGLKKNKL